MRSFKKVLTILPSSLLEEFHIYLWKGAMKNLIWLLLFHDFCLLHRRYQILIISEIMTGLDKVVQHGKDHA